MYYALQVVMRCLHFCSLAVLLGGVAYWRLILMPSTVALPADERDELAEQDAARFRPFAWSAIAALIVSGLFNILAFPGHNMRHNILLGIKLLLATHVFAAALLAVRPGNKRRGRILLGAVIVGVFVIGISTYLRVFY
jgi:uncharacterized membrane protein